MSKKKIKDFKASLAWKSCTKSLQKNNFRSKMIYILLPCYNGLIYHQLIVK